jgi:transcriptional regulator with XRE-family HTH domain
MAKSSQASEMFPERLRAAREKRGLSQGELAARAGLQASAISHFETGTRKPSFDNLRRLADALEVTTDYLLGRVTDTEALAGADRLHRHLDRLTSDDRDVAEQFVKYLADKGKAQKKKGDE